MCSVNAAHNAPVNLAKRLLAALVSVVARAEDVIGAVEAELKTPKPPVLFKV